jgi:hypothetical protein
MTSVNPPVSTVSDSSTVPLSLVTLRVAPFADISPPVEVNTTSLYAANASAGSSHKSPLAAILIIFMIRRFRLS